jgi:hypothetical protein
MQIERSLGIIVLQEHSRGFRNILTYDATVIFVSDFASLERALAWHARGQGFDPL